jgi:O-antigen ligase
MTPVVQTGRGRFTALVGMAIMLILVSFGRAHELFGPTAVIPVGKIMLPVGILLLASRPNFPRRIAALGTTQGRFFLLFLAAMVASVPFSLWIGGSVQELMNFAMAQLPYVVILIGTGYSEDEIDWLLRGVVLSVVLFAGVIVTGGGSAEEGRVIAGSTYDSNEIAMMAAVSIPFSLRLVTSKAKLWRGMGLAGLGSALLLVLQSGSRGGALAVSAVVLSYLSLFRKAISGGMKAALVAAICIGLALAPGLFLSRLASLGSISQDYNVTDEVGRIEIWRRGIGYFLHHPLTGVGLGQFNAAEGQSGTALVAAGEGFKWSTAHNSFILPAAELGLPGIIGFLGLFLPIFPLAHRMRRQARLDTRSASWAGLGETLAVATIGFLVAGFFLSGTYEPVAMTLAALLISYAGVVKQVAKSQTALTLPRSPRQR